MIKEKWTISKKRKLRLFLFWVIYPLKAKKSEKKKKTKIRQQNFSQKQKHFCGCADVTNSPGIYSCVSQIRNQESVFTLNSREYQRNTKNKKKKTNQRVIYIYPDKLIF